MTANVLSRAKELTAMADINALTPNSPRKPRLWLSITGDRALIGGGVAMAFCSTVFAGYMIADTDRQPVFPGGEYLAIFSKPSHSHGIQVAAHPAPMLARLEAPGDANGIDPTPTGSIGGAARAEPPDAAGLPPPRYRLVSASPEAAWVDSELGFRQVRPGEVLSGFGQVAAIEKRNGRWALIAISGSILELTEAGSSSLADQRPEGRFARPMIFGPPPH
jgi:hypothetical protein